MRIRGGREERERGGDPGGVAAGEREQEDHRDGMLGAAVRERSGERAAGGGRDRGV